LVLLTFWDTSEDVASDTPEDEVGKYAIVSTEAKHADRVAHGDEVPKKGGFNRELAIMLLAVLAVIAAVVLGVLSTIDQVEDTDGDGFPDDDDAFPQDAAEWKDSDGDSRGDNSDAFPNDPDEWEDNDGDGMGNNGDTDDDNDEVEDTEDMFPLADAVLIIKLDNLTLIDQVDEDEKDDADPNASQLWLVVRVAGMGEPIHIPASGATIVGVGQTWVVNQTLVFNVPDNTTQWDIEIDCWDDDTKGANDAVDISPTTNEGLHLSFDLVSGTLTGDVTGAPADGSDDGSDETDDNDAMLWFVVTMTLEPPKIE
jgi:hypothetical protein